jgi:hypothetical protein
VNFQFTSRMSDKLASLSPESRLSSRFFGNFIYCVRIYLLYFRLILNIIDPQFLATRHLHQSCRRRALRSRPNHLLRQRETLSSETPHLVFGYFTVHLISIGYSKLGKAYFNRAGTSSSFGRWVLVCSVTLAKTSMKSTRSVPRRWFR